MVDRRRPVTGQAGSASAMRIGLVIAGLWAVLLVIVLAQLTDGVVRVVTIFGILAGMFAAFFQQVKFPAIGRGAVAATLMLDLLVSLGLTGWLVYRANRTIDVTAQLALADNINVRPDGHAATEIEISTSRKAIVVVFRVVDHNGAIGSCVPNTLLVVTPNTAGNLGAAQSVKPDVPVTIHLAPHAHHLHLDVAVRNVRDDVNCGVDLAISRAVLTNG